MTYKINIFSQKDPATFDKIFLQNRYLKQRYHHFIEELRWSGFSDNGCEYDQYDLPNAYYLMLTRNSELIAGARLIRSDSLVQYGNTKISYMIRDWQEGRLGDEADEILYEEAPTDPETFEISRMVSNGLQDLRHLIRAGHEVVEKLGGKRCVFLTFPTIKAVAARCGIATKQIGPSAMGEDGRMFCAMESTLKEAGSAEMRLAS